MHCQSCGFKNPEGLKFCNECGAPLQNTVIPVRVCESASGQVLWRMWGRASPKRPSLDRPTSGLTPSQRFSLALNTEWG
jgi:hypothetical protein